MQGSARLQELQQAVEQELGKQHRQKAQPLP
jgi:hypothetical protein